MSVATVAERIAAIRQRFDPPRPATTGFGEMLAAATVKESAAPAPTPDVPRSVTPVGMLGTSLRLAPGASVAGGSSVGWVDRLPPAGRRWADEIERAAVAAGIDPRLLAAVVWTESGFDPGAVSRSGAIGLGQLTETTAAGLHVDPRDPVSNLRGAARYLARNLRSFGTVALAAAAYNAGPGAVRRSGGHPYVDDPGGYVQRVEARYRLLGGTHP